MTIRTKRRGWRSLAAILAAMLMASVLAVVAGSPAQAANTAGEHMVDTNDDGKPDSRQFAGADRYATSLALAKQYATAQGGLGSIGTVILASGESQIDAVAAAGLAGYKQAPVLLTRSTGLDQGAARFIEEHGVSTVVIVGGTAVLPDAVATQVEDLDSEPKVMRLAGADRHATAAAISSEIGTTGSWCGTDDTTAVLVNGMDMTDAISAGPVAYALELPLLLAGADVLPEASSAFISDEKVERVVILGGAGSVSEGVADAVKALGASVTRVGGESAAETSAMLAKLMTGDCRDDLQTDTSRVALVNSVATADGVSAGPVLGAGFGGGPVPVLLVTDELPASVRDYLAATPEVDADGAKTHLSVVAVGGTAVVSEAVMAAAVEAASSADALSAEIKASPTAADAVDDDGIDLTDLASGTFTLEFSDSVDTGSYSKLKDALYVNGSPASIMTDAEDNLFIAGTPGASCASKAKLTVTLTHPLKQGDRIEVRPTAVTTVGSKVGDVQDRRVLSAASFTVPAAKAPDTSRPTTEIIAVASHPSDVTANTTSQVVVVSSKEGMGDPSKVKIRRGSTTVALAAASAYSVDATAFAPFGFRYVFAVSIGDGDGELADGLKAGDTVLLDAGAIKADGTDTLSRADNRKVAAPVKSFRVSSIQISPVDPNVDDDPATVDVMNKYMAPGDNGNPISHPAWIDIDADGSVDDGADSDAVHVRITSKWDGDAAGAAGNDWSVSVDSVSNYNDDPKTPAEIDVSVNERNKVIRVRYLAGEKITVRDLEAALNGNDDFADRFTAKAMNTTANVDDCAKETLDTAVVRGTVTGVRLVDGRSSVGVEVVFNDMVAALNSSNLRDDVFGELVPGWDADGALVTTGAGLGTDAEDAVMYSVPAARPAAGAYPYNRVQFLFTTKDASKLPGSRTGAGKGIVTIGTGADYVATSYRADDATTTDVNETQNAGGEKLNVRVSTNRRNVAVK